MQYTITNKNLMQLASKQSFYDKLKEALIQNICSTEESYTKAFEMSNEILQSGATLKICSLRFKASINKNPLSGNKGCKIKKIIAKQFKKFNYERKDNTKIY